MLSRCARPTALVFCTWLTDARRERTGQVSQQGTLDMPPGGESDRKFSARELNSGVS